MQHQGDGMPRRDEIEKHGNVGGCERLDPGVALQHLGKVRDVGQSLREQFGHGHGRLQHQRRMNHIPEIQNAADRPSGGIDQEVAGVAVPMDRLAAQPSQPWKACRHGFTDYRDTAPDRCRFDEGSELHEFGQSTNVPGDALGQSGMEKTLQGLIHSRQGFADVQ
jgi:hypothetical protein